LSPSDKKSGRNARVLPTAQQCHSASARYFSFDAEEEGKPEERQVKSRRSSARTSSPAQRCVAIFHSCFAPPYRRRRVQTGAGDATGSADLSEVTEADEANPVAQSLRSMRSEPSSSTLKRRTKTTGGLSLKSRVWRTG